MISRRLNLMCCFLPLSRNCVRERCARRGSASSATADTAAGFGPPRKQVLLVPDTGEEVTLMFCTVSTCILIDLDFRRLIAL